MRAISSRRAAPTLHPRPRRRQAWRALGAVLLLGGTVFGLVFFYLWLSWQRVYWAEQVTRARTRLEQVTIEHQTLQAEVAEAFSLARLSRLARELGMVEPELRYWPPK